MKNTFIYIASVMAFLGAFLWTIPGSEGVYRLRGDGHLMLYNLHLEEAVSVNFRNKNGSYNADALKLINHTLRCRKTHQIVDISPELLDLVDTIQDHFGGEPIHVISAYRSPQLNESLRRSGHQVARHSLHMSGLAMDIRIPGIRTRDLREYAKRLHQGGVGFYPSNEFVHVDVGRVRYW